MIRELFYKDEHLDWYAVADLVMGVILLIIFFGVVITFFTTG